MRKLIYIILVFVILGCKKEKYVLWDAVRGRVFSNGVPVEGAKIYIDILASNSFDTIRTNDKGEFFVSGSEVSLSPSYGNAEYNKIYKRLSYTFFIEKKEYKLKVKNIENDKRIKNNKLDTIDLGYIYIERDR